LIPEKKHFNGCLSGSPDGSLPQQAGFGQALANLLGVPLSETGVGPFAPVYVNDGLTIDFDEWTEPFNQIHYCFRVDPDDFDAILGRIRVEGIPYRSSVHGPVDQQIDTQHGGRIVYWNEPDGHEWEMLTVSYARQPA